MKPVLAGFEDYLPLLFFLVVWWITAKKKKTMQPPAGSPSSPADKGGKGFDLQETLRQLLSGEVEMPRPPNRPPIPQRQEDAAVRPSVGNQPVNQEIRDSVATKSDKAAARTPPQPLAPAPASTMAQSAPPCRRVPPPSSAGSICRQSLRSAVIWSEILGPPVSLREK